MKAFMNARVVLAATALTGFATAEQAALPVAFDLIVSSGSGTPNGLTIPAPILEPGDGPGTIFRFSGTTGALLDSFAEEFENDLQDPRDLVLDGAAFGAGTTLLVNVADFNNPEAAPGDGVIDLDGIFRYSLDGEFIEQFVDFTTALDVPVSPGGGVFGPTTDPDDDPSAQSYYIGSRAQGDILEIDPNTGELISSVPGTEEVDFPRGFVFGPDGSLFLGSGSNPATGGGDDAILRINPTSGESEVFFSAATSGIPFSPLDVILSPGGTALITSSESPFSPGVATASQVLIIPLDFETADDVIVLDPGNDADGEPILVDPRGLGVGPDGLLYVSSAGNDRILRFDPLTGGFVDIFATAPGLNGQALNFIPAATELDLDDDPFAPVTAGCFPGVLMTSMLTLGALGGMRSSRRSRRSIR